MMFKMAPQQALSIIDQVTRGKVWKFKKQVSDQQAQVAENYLTGLGFQVERAGGEAPAASPIADRVDLEDEAPQPVASESVEGADAEKAMAPAKRVAAAAAPGQSPKGLNIGFHGNGTGLLKIMFVNWLLIIVTFGIYYFWGKTKIRRYLWEQSSFAGDRFYYYGTGGELFKGALLFTVILILFKLGVEGTGQMMGPEAMMTAQTLLTFAILLLLPAIMVGAYRYRLSRTAWRGIRFSFRGTRKSATALYVKGYLLTFLTLGFYWPYFVAQKQEFWKNNSYFGNKEFKYTGTGKGIFGEYVLFLLLYPITLGIYMFWYQAAVDRYNWSKTEFAGGRFNYDATGGQWFGLHFVNFLLLMLTMGLAYPWVIVRTRQFVADHLSVEGQMQLTEVVQQAQKSSALGEGAADGFDMDVDIGF
ncbi:MAG: DUF898 domain-containing protein [Nitrospinaceae bacterium]|nr:DUF898 domain-containing protein [Nitrospinaceae bacterium]NIS86319.1 DUF898 domain-containing protein [Nitrospinaceae bacterium]NIU45358.1 DUF898 domain-containing protein [Nitrospinaceae bacterium]NIU97512.1 DUF898 family protein [Nitrospinaceae bacterium]NIW60098.1 DUF898 family protein [Nitrospinaceae bacterium]